MRANKYMYIPGFVILIFCYFNEFMQTYVKSDYFKVLMLYIYIYIYLCMKDK